MAKFRIFPEKHPTSKLDYVFDWAPKSNNTGVSNWLKDGETIISYSVTVPTGLTKVSDNVDFNNTAIVIWLSGGTLLTDYDISCSIVTSLGREDTRSATIQVREK